MRVRIVCYEDVHQWIIGKFALKMEENLKSLGNDVDIATMPDLKADINHHIIYGGYGSVISNFDSLMITHIDTIDKVFLLKKQMQSAKIGICMSRESMINLCNLGIPRSKLCYVNPAHDGVIKPKQMVVGITCRVQNDGRKREYMLGELAKVLDPNEFSFKIMGEYWTSYIEILRNRGFTVEYYDKFNYNIYTKLIPSLDYYLYMGQDEGQMGFIDALAAGVKTIVTPQGYHLDANGGISYPFQTMDELINIFKSIAEEKRRLINSVKTWNWYDYSEKHLDIWNYLSRNNTNIIDLSRKNYTDGIKSMESFSEESHRIFLFKKIKIYLNLLKEKLRHLYYIKKNKNRGL